MRSHKKNNFYFYKFKKNIYFLFISCDAILCRPTGGKSKLVPGSSFRIKA